MKDRLAALAGVMTKYQVLFGDIRLLGLWRKSIPAGLLWRVSFPGRRIPRIVLPNAPSWSWISIDAPVKLVYDDRCREKVRLISTTDIEWQNTPMTSNVIKAKLELKGAMMPKDRVPSGAQFWFNEDPRLSDNEIKYLEVLMASKRVVYGHYLGSHDSVVDELSLSTTYFLMWMCSPEHEGYVRVGMGPFEEGGLYSASSLSPQFTREDRNLVKLAKENRHEIQF